MGLIIEDEVSDRSRSLYIDCDRYSLLGELVHDSAYVSHTHYGETQTTVTLCTDSFLQSVDVMSSLHPSVELEFDDYFSGGQSEDKDTCTSVILHPYVERPELSEETGRDYKNEMDQCISYIKSVAEDMES